MEDVLMSEFEKSVNEVDAAEMLEEFGKSDAAQAAERIMAEAAQEPCEEGETGGGCIEERCGEFTVKLSGEAERWVRRQKRDACALALLSQATWFACAVALMTGFWEPIVAGIALVNLMMTGAWMHKAKVGLVV